MKNLWKNIMHGKMPEVKIDAALYVQYVLAKIPSKFLRSQRRDFGIAIVVKEIFNYNCDLNYYIAPYQIRYNGQLTKEASTNISKYDLCDSCRKILIGENTIEKFLDDFEDHPLAVAIYKGISYALKEEGGCSKCKSLLELATTY